MAEYADCREVVSGSIRRVAVFGVKFLVFVRLEPAALTNVTVALENLGPDICFAGTIAAGIRWRARLGATLNPKLDGN